MSEPRKCQFFLRGRCQRECCEFSHDMPANTTLTNTANGSKDQQSGSPSISMKSAPAHSELSAFARGKGSFIANKVR